MWLDLTLGPSFKVKRGWPNFKVLITHLLLILEVHNAKPTHTKSWARNLLTLDLTFGPSFKVKQWFIGFGGLSSGGYKFAWVLRCVGLVGHLTFAWFCCKCTGAGNELII